MILEAHLSIWRIKIKAGHEVVAVSDVLFRAGLIEKRVNSKANNPHPALDAGLIEYKNPNMPDSHLQKFRLTENGQKSLSIAGDNDA